MPANKHISLSTEEISRLLNKTTSKITIKALQSQEEFHVGHPEPKLPWQFVELIVKQENAERESAEGKASLSESPASNHRLRIR